MSEQSSTQVERALLTVAEVAERIGCNRATVWRMISSGRFGPAVLHLGRMVRVRRAEFDVWVMADCPPRSRWTWKGGSGE